MKYFYIVFQYKIKIIEKNFNKPIDKCTFIWYNKYSG